MSQQQIILPTEFNPSSIMFSGLKKNTNNAGRSVFMNLENSKRLFMQLPAMKAPFGLSSFTDDASGKTSYTIPLSFDRNDDLVCNLRDKLSELDEIVAKTVESNSKEWLGKKYNMAVIKEALYKPVVKQPKDEQYDPTITIKVLCSGTGKFVPKFYNADRQEVDPNTIDKQQKLVCIVSISSVWFVDNKFGISVKLEQCLLKPSEKLNAFAFRDQGEESEEEVLDDDY